MTTKSDVFDSYERGTEEREATVHGEMECDVRHLYGGMCPKCEHTGRMQVTLTGEDAIRAARGHGLTTLVDELKWLGLEQQSKDLESGKFGSLLTARDAVLSIESYLKKKGRRDWAVYAARILVEDAIEGKDLLRKETVASKDPTEAMHPTWFSELSSLFVEAGLAKTDKSNRPYLVGMKIMAVKLVREKKFVGLREAVDIVDTWIRDSEVLRIEDDEVSGV